jgi:hypothetical protein
MIGEDIHRYIKGFNTIKTDVPKISSWIQNERNMNKKPKMSSWKNAHLSTLREASKAIRPRGNIKFTN